MKKRILCGSAAILMTGLTVSVFTTAAPRAAPLTVVAPTSIADDAALASERRLIGAIEVPGSRHAS